MPTKIAPVSPAGLTLLPLLSKTLHHLPVVNTNVPGMVFTSLLPSTPHPSPRFSPYDKKTADWGPQTTTMELPQFWRLEVHSGSGESPSLACG